MLHIWNRRARRWRFTYKDAETQLDYELKPGTRFWEPVVVKLNGTVIGNAMTEAGLKFVAEPQDARLIQVQSANGELKASWRATVNGTEVVIQSTVRLWQKSLVVDCICTGGLATELSYGRIDGVASPELLLLPFMNYGGHHLNVLMSRGRVPYFASVWMDWYRSNASAPYCVDKIEGDKVQLNGGVRYLPKTDGRRNDLFERFFVTFSPALRGDAGDHRQSAGQSAARRPPHGCGRKAGVRTTTRTSTSGRRSCGPTASRC